MSLKKITLNVASISSANFLRMLTQIFVVPILARFLSPADYGVVAIAMPFVLFAMMFADAGISMSLVREKDKNPIIWSTCFWICTGLGLILTFFIIALGPLTAYVMSEPRLGPIITALAFVILLQSMATVPGASLQQNHKFGTIASIEILSMVISITTAILVAVKGGGAWALVAQQLAQYITKLIFIFPFSKYRPSFIFNIREAKDHLRFGRDMLGIQFIAFMTQSIDSLMIGYVKGPASTGIYSMAMLFARLPARLVSGPLQFVTYPQISQIKEKQTELITMYTFLSRTLAIIVVPVISLIAVAHEPFFHILLSEKWAQAGTIFMLVAPALGFQAVVGIGGTFLFALGRTDLSLRQITESFFLRSITILTSVWFGLEWVAIAYAVTSICYVPRQLSFVLHAIQCPAFRYIKSIILPIIVSGIMVIIYLVLNRVYTFGDWSQVTLALSLVFGGVLSSAAIQKNIIIREVKYLQPKPTI